MTDDKGAGEGPFTKIECLRHFETWAKSFIFSGDGIRDVEVVEPRLGYSIELAIANRLYAEGRKAERERCLEIVGRHPGKCDETTPFDCLQEIKYEIGGKDAK